MDKLLFVLVRWSGVKSITIVEKDQAKIPDESLIIGKLTSIHHVDGKNREKTYEGKILGFGTLQEMESLNANFKDFDESNDPAPPPTPNLTASGLKRQRKVNSLYTENYLDPNKLSSVLNSAEKYKSKSEAKKQKVLEKEEKNEVEKVKKNLYEDIMNVEGLSFITTSNHVLNSNNNSPNSNEKSSVLQQSLQPFQPQPFQHQPFQHPFQHQPFQTQTYMPQFQPHQYNMYPPQMQYQQYQKCNEITGNENWNTRTLTGIGSDHSSVKNNSDNSSDLSHLSNESDIIPDVQQEKIKDMFSSGKGGEKTVFFDQLEIEQKNSDEENSALTNHDSGFQDGPRNGENDDESLNLRFEDDEQTPDEQSPSNGKKSSDKINAIDSNSLQDGKDADNELRKGFSLVYGVLSNARTKQQLSDGLQDVIDQLGQSIRFPLDKPNTLKAVFNTEKIKLVELVHGAGVMASKTEKELTVKEANGDQRLLVTGALDMIYGQELATMSALGTRGNTAIDKTVYKVIYLFATHNKGEEDTNLTKTEYNKIINDHCCVVRNKIKNQSKSSSGENKKESKKNTGGKKNLNPLIPKPKTKAQITRKEKMRSLSEIRKRENLKRKNKVLE